MKAFKKIVDAIKWRIIVYINRKYPEACWFNLVMWHEGGYTLRETFGSEESRWNTQDCSTAGGGAFCGKCNQTGRLNEKEISDIDLTEVLTKGFVV